MNEKQLIMSNSKNSKLSSEVGDKIAQFQLDFSNEVTGFMSIISNKKYFTDFTNVCISIIINAIQGNISQCEVGNKTYDTITVRNGNNVIYVNAVLGTMFHYNPNVLSQRQRIYSLFINDEDDFRPIFYRLLVWLISQDEPAFHGFNIKPKNDGYLRGTLHLLNSANSKDYNKINIEQSARYKGSPYTWKVVYDQFMASYPEIMGLIFDCVSIEIINMIENDEFGKIIHLNDFFVSHLSKEAQSRIESIQKSSKPEIQQIPTGKWVEMVKNDPPKEVDIRASKESDMSWADQAEAEESSNIELMEQIIALKNQLQQEKKKNQQLVDQFAQQLSAIEERMSAIQV